MKAVIQCSVKAVPWMDLEDSFIARFELDATLGNEQIVPMSSLCHPICVVPDFGAVSQNRYMMILPKGQWSEYFSRFVNED